MKRISLLFLIGISLSLNTISAQTFQIDPMESILNWTGEKVTGKHFGTIMLKEGSFSIENDKISSGSFSVDMSSIKNLDIENEKYNQKLVGHLMSDDFFAVESFPVASFQIGESSDIKGGKVTLKGDLTIKGITQAVEFDAIIDKTAERIKVYGNMVIDRTLFDVRYGSGNFFDNLGDKTIYDEFTLKLDITAK